MNTEQFEGHTPGEWVRSHRRKTYTNTHFITINSSDGKYIASTHGKTIEEVEANAALIIAAPTLLSENIQLRKVLEGLVEEHTGLLAERGDMWPTDALTNARNLLDQGKIN